MYLAKITHTKLHTTPRSNTRVVCTSSAWSSVCHGQLGRGSSASSGEINGEQGLRMQLQPTAWERLRLRKYTHGFQKARIPHFIQITSWLYTLSARVTGSAPPLRRCRQTLLCSSTFSFPEFLRQIFPAPWKEIESSPVETILTH